MIVDTIGPKTPTKCSRIDGTGPIHPSPAAAAGIQKAQEKGVGEREEPDEPVR